VVTIKHTEKENIMINTGTLSIKHTEKENIMINTGTLSINQIHSNDDSRDQKICMRVLDVNSRVEFLTIYMDAKEFALALTGLSGQDITFEIRRADIVGKKKERKPLTIYFSEDDLRTDGISSTNKKELSKHIEKHQDRWVDVGWTIEPYLGSQNSVTRVDNGVLLNVSQTRYV
jgi:hypothetical protein